MSGLEVVGAIASISQLAQCTGKLIIRLRDLSENVHRSSESFQKYQKRANDLQQIINLMKENDALQSETLKAPIEALLQTIQAILKVLSKKFVDDPSNPSKKWKNWAKGARIPQAESSISERFDDLERHKSTLALVMLENLGGYIHRIDARLASGIPEIHSKVQNIEHTLLACSTVAENSKIPKPMSIRPALASVQSDYGSSMDSDTAVPDQRSIPDTESVEDPRHKGGRKRVYADNRSLEESVQVNGEIGGNGFSEQCFAVSTWSNNTASGQSRQVNGDVFDPNFAFLFFSR